MYPNKLRIKISKQSGVMTLVISLVLLFAVTLITFTTARTAVVEQRISANDYRAKQSFEAAEAGLQFALGYLSLAGGADQDVDDVVDTAIQPAGSKYTITMSTPTVGDLELIQVLSTGTSDDGTASHIIQELIQIKPPTGNTPSHPLISKNVVNVTGNGDITNTQTNATIWSGGAVSAWGAGGTYIDNGNGGTVQSSGKFGSNTSIGLDIVDDSADLANATNDEFFENFFSGDRDYIRNVADLDTSDDPNFSAADLDLVVDQLIWVEGDIRLNSNTIIGCSNSSVANCDPDVVGGAVDPVILVVNGNLRANGTVNIFGIVYVVGDWDVQGTFNVIGAVIVEGGVSGNGTFNLTYNSTVLGSSLWNPKATKVSGTWKNW